ncbi:potassium-transporting ATPase subunit KdpC [Paradevosia shaoguanensis]|uniref:Potassium-transporting ATPase KdpC subunit n=1 Tax=Paradevosia shaoguanensis TaxID=1335043 RepID=A0AA41UAJ8_9HYPH|nr:potassium-transporting ATPase subunit KdpC [Paradevosia shaoguanensis]MCF1741980.1 potassium-transporting ATPase subunit KdpC [Paradevosia shaoguanensis]MCI0126463.1 potassium-transporting ATPase subunit KdpC [Paradevosia shaoguanensis]
MFADLRPAIATLGLLTLLTGVAYPLAITGIGQAAFPRQANGSMIEKDGKVIGSAFVGQSFQSDRYFHGRPSATGPDPYNAAASSGSNLGPSSKVLVEQVKERAATLGGSGPVPADLVTASGSGLDPDISPAAAAWQVERVAAARGLTKEQVEQLVAQHTQGRDFGMLGQPRVNVLALNLALDALKP